MAAVDMHAEWIKPYSLPATCPVTSRRPISGIRPPFHGPSAGDGVFLNYDRTAWVPGAAPPGSQ
jgi:hypothetical protein